MLFCAMVVNIFFAKTIGRIWRRNHAATLTTTCELHKWKVVTHLAMSRPPFRLQDLLHRFKQCRRKNWRKASFVPFVVMFNEAEICSVRQHSYDGSFAKWRFGVSSQTKFSQKLRQ